MRAGTLNWHDSGCYTEMTAPSSNVYSKDEEESKRITVHKTLSHKYSADVEKLCSTDIDRSEYTITEQKDEGNEVTSDVPNFNVSNIFKCGRNNPDVSYERAYMDTSGNGY